MGTADRRGSWPWPRRCLYGVDPRSKAVGGVSSATSSESIGELRRATTVPLMPSRPQRSPRCWRCRWTVGRRSSSFGIGSLTEETRLDEHGVDAEGRDLRGDELVAFTPNFAAATLSRNSWPAMPAVEEMATR